MQNFDKIIENSMLALKGVLVTIITAIGLSGVTGINFPDHSTTTSNPQNKTNIYNNTISSSTIDQSIKEVETIIGVLSKKKLTSTSENSNNSKFKLDKLNMLQLVADEYQTVETKKNKQHSGEQETNTKETIRETGFLNMLSPTPNQDTAITSQEIDITKTNSEESIVNIRCESKNGSKIKVITGSGIIISRTGSILTAAHVAAPVYASEQGQNYTCFARIKNPASEQIPIKTIFIHPKWVSLHFHEFDQSYLESGEYDFAILKINLKSSKFTNKNNEEQTSLINKINSLARANLGLNSVKSEDLIKISAYPAGDYQKYGVTTALYRKTESNQINSILTTQNYSYGHNLLETQNSSLEQSGASGGGIFDNQGNLIALISNSVPSDTSLGQKKIRGVLLSYINISIKQITGKSLNDF